MIYPGTSPTGSGFGTDPNSLEQRKQQLLQQMAGGGIRNNLSFGGSMGDAPGRAPSLGFNPMFAAAQQLLGVHNMGQAGNAAVSAQPFFGGVQNIGGNGAQAAGIQTGAAAGSAGLGGTAGSAAAAPVIGNIGGVSNPQSFSLLPPGAAGALFGGRNGLGQLPGGIAPQAGSNTAALRPLLGML